ncbi:hypothetical protein ACFX13_022389 [Malus domestica]
MADRGGLEISMENSNPCQVFQVIEQGDKAHVSALSSLFSMGPPLLVNPFNGRHLSPYHVLPRLILPMCLSIMQG